MADEHPLEQLLRDAKEKDDIKLDFEDKVRLQWVRTKAGLDEEIERANAVLEKHNLPERYTFRELSQSGTDSIAHCNLALAYPSKSARAEYDLTVLAADGRMILLHRATGQRHHKLTVFTATRKNWENILIGLYEDHLKKGRDPSQNPAEPATGITPAPVARRKSP